MYFLAALCYLEVVPPLEELYDKSFLATATAAAMIYNQMKYLSVQNQYLNQMS